MPQYKVACFGAGFVGIPTASVLALHNPEIEFVVYDINRQRIQRCNKCDPPIYQPGLVEVLSQTINKNLTFTHQIGKALEKASVIFLALPTPTKNFGEQKGKAYDLSYTEVGVRNIVKYYNDHDLSLDQVILVEKSTVPIGTSKMIDGIIKATSVPKNRSKFTVASNPQFLAEGTAVQDLMKPDRVVLGHQENRDIQRLSQLYNYAGKDRVIFTNNASAQLSKLAANCFLAQRVSSINSMAILCEEYGADVNELRKCISTDTRIGDKFLNSSVGFGGSCFKKDILALIYLAECKGLYEVAEYWENVIKMNEFRKKNFFLKVYKSLNHNLCNKKISIFGTAFKKDTNDPRESPAVEICSYLLLEGAHLQIHDPKTSIENFIDEIKVHELWKEEFSSRLKAFEQADESVEGSSAILILTEWDVFKTYNYHKFYQQMQKPSYIFDGRKLLDEEKLKEIGFRYCRVGKKFEDQ